MRRLYSIFLGTSLLWFLIAVSWIQRLSQSSLVSTPASTTLAASAPRLEYSNTFVPPRDSFSACVMFKDDTHRLIEWLAYHYHVLRLRHVVIGVDGGSVTYPTEIVDRYNDLMKITLWPKDIFAPDSDMNVSERKKNMDAANLYIRRQTLFLRKCALHLKDQDRSWTAFIDPDEYLLFNYPGGAKPPPSAPEEIRDYVMPSMRQEGILYSFLRQEQSKDGSYSSPCITVPRLLFGSSTTPLKNGVAKLLDTLRYLSHANRRDFKSNRQAKTIMDVSRFAANQLASLKNVHKMVPDACWNPMLSEEKSLLKINHYLGSRQSFFHRQDDRDQYGRTNEYDKFADTNDGTDDTITGWYDGFVEKQGKQVADRLLEGAGIL